MPHRASQASAPKHFICEGTLLVQRLIESRFQVESILVHDAWDCSSLNGLNETSTVYSLPKTDISQLVGFDFHRGVLACGLRQPLEDITECPTAASRNDTLVVAVGISDPNNLGNIIRTASALSVRALIIDSLTVDPFARRSMRVSMGAALSMPIFTASNLPAWLDSMKSHHDSQIIATSLSATAYPIVQFKRRGPAIVLLGNEYDGLSPDLQSTATDVVTIPMSSRVDSLNVAVAAGIVLHEVSRDLPSTAPS